MATEVTIQCGTIIQGDQGAVRVVTDVGDPGEPTFSAGRICHRAVDPLSIIVMSGEEIKAVAPSTLDLLALTRLVKEGCSRAGNGWDGLVLDFESGLRQSAAKGPKVLSL